MQTIMLDAGRCPDKAAVHSALKLLLDLPAYYGANADALHDCLSERRERVNLWIAGTPAPEAEGALETVCEVVRDLGGQAVHL
jgi:ribonuclease inhibitor